MKFNERCDNLKRDFELFFFSYIEREFEKYPQLMKESMLYALQGEGKRIRPIIFLALCQSFGEIDESKKLFACAIEILHNYTLVHDDLPCMDNDDYRRGRLTVHKKFGEDIAVLCGDALQNFAYETVALAIEKAENKENAIKAFRLFSKVCGGDGVVGGQICDINHDAIYSAKDLEYVYSRKTAGLFVASAGCSAMLCGVDESDAIKFGEDFGYLFQLTDDLLDSDDCFSIKKVYSSEEITKILDSKRQNALKLAQKIDKSGFLYDLTIYLCGRRS